MKLLDRYRIIAQPNPDGTGLVSVEQQRRRWWGGTQWKPAEGWEDWTWSDTPNARESTIAIARKWIAARRPAPVEPASVVYDTADDERRAEAEFMASWVPTFVPGPPPTPISDPRRCKCPQS